MAEDFESNGKEVVEKVRTERPRDYLKIIAAVMPTRTEIEKVVPARRACDMTDDELVAVIDETKRQLAILNAADTMRASKIDEIRGRRWPMALRPAGARRAR